MGLRAKTASSNANKLGKSSGASSNSSDGASVKCGYSKLLRKSLTKPAAVVTAASGQTRQRAKPEPQPQTLQCRAACITTTISNSSTTTTTSNNNAVAYRSSSTSELVSAVCLRPQTLNVQHPRQSPTDHTQLFLGEILNAWRAKARCNAVPAERTQELFHELSFHPSDKQISEMLQTAKMLARKGSRQSNGLTFGEFCVLAADLKRFRTSAFPTSVCDKSSLLSSLHNETDTRTMNKAEPVSNCSILSTHAGTQLRSTKSLSNVEDCNKKPAKASDTSGPVEVFLGGSCNPTTWRADVAIPALKESGISFYNPQVSDWTPDLIELEHRAKEKARVLFFVMDSETRASAGAIEAAHIAGQNCKQLVLVLHPYKPNQYIMNEHISQQEYIDLMRNQLILKELVTRRGLPVLDNIPAGLQRTKEILAGIRHPPSNIASILVVVRGAFDRVGPVNDVISVEQCQRALLYLGYAQSLVNIDNLNKLIASQRESLDSLQKRSTKQYAQGGNAADTPAPAPADAATSNAAISAPPSTTQQPSDIDFDLFCVISAYLSVLQQEIHESGCISPIKGTNVPPPPVYLTNMQSDENFPTCYFTSKNISRTSSNTSVPSTEERQNLNDLLSRSRDSGTSSPQPQEPLKSRSAAHLVHTQSPSALSMLNTAEVNGAEEESDSNDSVFSSSSSINSVNYSYSETQLFSSLDFRDVYLGGSCFLRTKWRRDVAMPYLKSKGVTFHLPAQHESILPGQLDLSDKAVDDTRTIGSFIRTRRKCRGAQVEEDEVTNTTTNTTTTTSEDSLSWVLSPVRPTLYNPSLLDSSRVLLFVITNETRSLAPMTLAAHCIGLMYNVVLSVQMLPEDCIISSERLTPAAIKDYNRGRSYLIDLAKRQGVPVFNDLKAALECTVERAKACNSHNRFD